VSTDEHAMSSPLVRALQAAGALGRVDGLLEREVFPVADPAPAGAWCHGRDPEGLAALVWGSGPGAPPAGVVLNAALTSGGPPDLSAPGRSARG